MNGRIHGATMMISFEAIKPKPAEQLEREDIARQALETAAKTLEGQATNPMYEKAWRAAARLVRSLKP
jgi:hypothetical protein